MKRWFTSVTLLAFMPAGKHNRWDIEAHMIKLFGTLVQPVKKALAEDVRVFIGDFLTLAQFCKASAL